MITKEEYEKTAIRMMDSVRKVKEYIGEFNCKGVECEDCPIGDSCRDSRMEVAYSILETVEKWGKEHPIPTNADKYREVFGVSPMRSETDEFVCPKRVGFTRDCRDNCTACKISFWTSEYKTPKGE